MSKIDKRKERQATAMEAEGIFRSAIGGFHKGDVLAYIDRITAGWEEERQQLNQQLTQAQQQAQEQTAAAESARQTAAQQAAELEALSRRSAEQAAELEALRPLQEQLEAAQDALRQTAEAQQAAQERCRVLETEVAQAKDQQQGATAEMMAAEERLNARTGELAACEQRLEGALNRIARYEAVLGQADRMESHMDGLVRPYLDKVSSSADRALSDTRAAVADIMSRLEQLADELTRRQNALCSAKADTDARLAETLSTWLQAAEESGGTPPDEHFFR